MDAVSSNFSHDFVETVIEKGFRKNDNYPNAVVEFERFRGGKI